MAPSLTPMRSSTKIHICSELVGMAGFEAAASCSQIRSGPSPGVAREGQKRLLTAVIVARRGLMLPRICRHWLPLPAPPELVSLLMFEYSNSVTGNASAVLHMRAVAVQRLCRSSPRAAETVVIWAWPALTDILSVKAGQPQLPDRVGRPTQMPNSGRCLTACLCTDWNVYSTLDPEGEDTGDLRHHAFI
jgi:hypothetical protein